MQLHQQSPLKYIFYYKLDESTVKEARATWNERTRSTPVKSQREGKASVGREK